MNKFYYSRKHLSKTVLKTLTIFFQYIRLLFTEIPGRVWVYIREPGGEGGPEPDGRRSVGSHQKVTENGGHPPHGCPRHADSGADAQAPLWSERPCGGDQEEALCPGPVQVGPQRPYI
mgnify:CR=1 FL=1